MIMYNMYYIFNNLLNRIVSWTAYHRQDQMNWNILRNKMKLRSTEFTDWLILNVKNSSLFYTTINIDIYSAEFTNILMYSHRNMVEAIGRETLVSISKAGPEMQVRMLQALGLKSTLITDGSSPINLFDTANGLIGALKPLDKWWLMIIVYTCLIICLFIHL